MSTKAITRTKRRAPISVQDVRAIAKLVARRLTESEACEVAGILPETWTKWKNRHGHDARFVRILTRVRATYIKGNFEQMEKAAGGKGGIRHDWRAADRLNAIVAPDRYATPQPPPPASPAPALPTLNVWIGAAYAQCQADAQAGAVVDVEAKEIADAPQPEAPPAKARENA